MTQAKARPAFITSQCPAFKGAQHGLLKVKTMNLTRAARLIRLRVIVMAVALAGLLDWLRLNGAGESLVWSAIDFENFAQPRPVLPERAAADLEAAVRLLAENGWPFRLHATYDETIRMDLAVLERTGAFPGGVRWILDHAETISPESIDRVAALGGAISVQHRMAYQGRDFAERHGPELRRCPGVPDSRPDGRRRAAVPT